MRVSTAQHRCQPADVSTGKTGKCIRAGAQASSRAAPHCTAVWPGAQDKQQLLTSLARIRLHDSKQHGAALLLGRPAWGVGVCSRRAAEQQGCAGLWCAAGTKQAGTPHRRASSCCAASSCVGAPEPACNGVNEVYKMIRFMKRALQWRQTSQRADSQHARRAPCVCGAAAASAHRKPALLRHKLRHATLADCIKLRIVLHYRSKRRVSGVAR